MSDNKQLQIEVKGKSVLVNLPCGHTLELSPEEARGVSEVLDEAAQVAESPEVKRTRDF